MTKIIFFKNGFDVYDHALFDENGKDIVCASVSGIILGSLNWFKKNDISKCEVDKIETKISFRLSNLSNDNLIALDLIKTQLLSIEKNYKNFLKIVNNDKIND